MNNQERIAKLENLLHTVKSRSVALRTERSTTGVTVVVKAEASPPSSVRGTLPSIPPASSSFKGERAAKWPSEGTPSPVAAPVAPAAPVVPAALKGMKLTEPSVIVGPPPSSTPFGEEPPTTRTFGVGLAATASTAETGRSSSQPRVGSAAAEGGEYPSLDFSEMPEDEETRVLARTLEQLAFQSASPTKGPAEPTTASAAPTAGAVAPVGATAPSAERPSAFPPAVAADPFAAPKVSVAASERTVASAPAETAPKSRAPVSAVPQSAPVSSQVHVPGLPEKKGKSAGLRVMVALVVILLVAAAAAYGLRLLPVH